MIKTKLLLNFSKNIKLLKLFLKNNAKLLTSPGFKGRMEGTSGAGPVLSWR